MSNYYSPYKNNKFTSSTLQITIVFNLQGILTEDTSEFWSASSVTTTRDIKTGMISSFPVKQTNIDSPLTMERIEQWRNHQTSLMGAT